MKRIFKQLLILAGLVIPAVISIPSCNNYLDVNPQGAITEEEIRSNPQAAENLVTGLYNVLWDEGIHSFDFIGMTDIASDDGDKGSTPSDSQTDKGALDNLTMDANTPSLNSVWSGYYRGIARVNQVLDKLPLSPLDTERKAQLEGEARFLRGYFYFNLVRFFGGVPLITSLPPNEELNNPSFQQKASREEVYQFIRNDLRFAADHLPEKGQTNAGRATKAAGMGLLAKVYFYEQNYQRAYELTDSIVRGLAGSYDLLPEYENLWREAGNNSIESIFEVQTGVNTACSATIKNYVQSQGPRQGGRGGWRDLGWGFNNPSESLVNEYEANDKRRSATVIFVNASGGTVLYDGFRIPSKDSVENWRYNYKAYHSRTTEQFCGSTDFIPKNLKILRFGEILLIHAESAFALGNSSAALNDINRLRRRADLPVRTSITREQIWHERRVEMAMEHDRYFDLVRQEQVQPGRAVDAFMAANKTWTKKRNEVFPIPAQQIQLSGNQLGQNEGY